MRAVDSTCSTYLLNDLASFMSPGNNADPLSVGDDPEEQRRVPGLEVCAVWAASDWPRNRDL
jgi:hypothetical protein